MKAVIMAGGKGTRLASVLKDIPKPMVKVAGKPLLEHQIDNLKENGIGEIILVVGHLGQVIQDYFKDGTAFGVTISYYQEQKPLGTAGALYYIKEQLKEDFLLLLGDIFTDINFQRLLDYHQAKGAAATLYTHPNSHPYDSDLVVTDQENRIVGWIGKKDARDQDYKNQVNAGVYVFSPDILKTIQENAKTDLERQVILNFINQGKVYAYCCSEYVKDIGTPERLKKVEYDYVMGICRHRNLKNLQKCIFLDRDGTINRHVGFLNHPNEMELEETSARAIQKINASEYLAIVISNQPVIARGECSFGQLERIHNRMDTLLGEQGAYLDGLYFCPHHPERGFAGEIEELKIECRCRKPETGLLEQAALDFHIDLKRSWFIGDTTRDVQTGKNAGIKTMLVLTGEGGRDQRYDVKPEAVSENLLACVDYILEEKSE